MKYLSPFAPDISGATAVLFGMKGLIVIIDAGGCTGKAPVTLLGDFLNGQQSKTFGRVQPSYPLGTVFARPESCLPEFVCRSLRQAPSSIP